MGKIVIIRGVHQNELGAYELAGRVHKRVKQHRECSLVTIPRKRTMWEVLDRWQERYEAAFCSEIPKDDAERLHAYVLDSLPQGPVDEQDIDKRVRAIWAEMHLCKALNQRIGATPDGEFSNRERQKDHIYSFHNYPVRADFRCSQYDVHARELQPERIGRFVYTPEAVALGRQTAKARNGYTELILLEWGGTIVELPALYCSSPRYTTSPTTREVRELFSSYAYDVDVQRTRKHDLLSDAVVDNLVRLILDRHAPRPPRQSKPEQPALFW